MKIPAISTYDKSSVAVIFLRLVLTFITEDDAKFQLEVSENHL